MHSRETIRLRNYVILTKRIEHLENQGRVEEAKKVRKVREENILDDYKGQNIHGEYK